MISFSNKGDFDKTKNFLKTTTNLKVDDSIRRIAEIGVKALSIATPVRTGLTASSWDYKIEKENGKTTIYFVNNNVVRGINIAIILQNGHGTKNGGYVQGIDYINPAIQPIFNDMSRAMWEAVVSK